MTHSSPMKLKASESEGKRKRQRDRRSRNMQALVDIETGDSTNEWQRDKGAATCLGERQEIAPMSGGETGEKQHGGDIETGESTNEGQQRDRGKSNMLEGL